MFSRNSKANNTVIGNEGDRNEVKPRRSSRLSMLYDGSENENRLTNFLKDGQGKPRVLGLAGRRAKPLIDEKNLPDSTVPSTISDRPSALTRKPHSFHDLRFGGGSTMVSVDFAEDIDRYIRHLEKIRRLESDFLCGKKVDGRMRQILVDWLMQVQHRFQLCSETLQLSVSTLDRALTRMDISKDNLQLLGVTCLFIASKFEEIYVPNIQDFVYIAAHIFTKKDVLRMEHLILHALKFELGCPYTIQFLRKYRTLLNADNETHSLAKFFAEIALLDYSLAHILPSKVAGTSVFLACKINRHEIPPRMFDVMEMSEAEMTALAKKFVPAIQQWLSPETKLQSLRSKFDKLYPNGKPAGFKNLDVFIELMPVPEEAEEA